MKLKHVSSTLGTETYKFSNNSGIQGALFQRNFDTEINIRFIIDAGSASNFKDSDNTTAYKPGLAHLTEHLILSDEIQGNNTFQSVLSKCNGHINASTSRTQTVFKVHAINDEQLLKFMLKRIFFPNITIQALQKEKGAIVNEIEMNLDNSRSFVGEKLISTLLENTTYQYAIAGSIESLNTITLSDVKSFIKQNYKPSNCRLMISGNFNVESIVSCIDEFFSTSLLDKESNKVCPKVEQKIELKIKKKKIAIQGIKRDRLILGIAKQIDFANSFNILGGSLILLDLLFGPRSYIKNQLMEKELIDETFTCSVSLINSYLILDFSAETNYLEKLKKEVNKIADILPKLILNISDNKFERVKRKIIGQEFTSFNSSRALVDNKFLIELNFTLDQVIHRLRKIDKALILNLVKDISNQGNSAISVIEVHSQY